MSIYLIQAPVVRLALLFSMVTLGLSGCGEPNQVAEPPVRAVKTVLLNMDNQGESFSQVGEIQADRETSLGFRLGGRLLERMVDVGDQVLANQVLATLDPRDVKNQLQSAEADLASALSNEHLATMTLQRYKKLAEKGMVSRAKVDQSQSDFEAAKSRHKSAQAALKNAKENLDYTKLRAPDAGVVMVVDANPGRVVSAGQQVIKLGSTDKKNAVFDVPESLMSHDLTKIKVTVSLLSDEEVKVIGHLRDVSPQADPITRTYRVRVALDNPPKSMVLGASVQGSITLDKSPVVSLPATALTREGDNAAVFVYDPDSQSVKRQNITIARYSDDSIFVSAGLHPGQRVVVAGVSTLRPGVKVTLLEDQR